MTAATVQPLKLSKSDGPYKVIVATQSEADANLDYDFSFEKEGAVVEAGQLEAPIEPSAPSVAQQPDVAEVLCGRLYS